MSMNRRLGLAFCGALFLGIAALLTAGAGDAPLPRVTVPRLVEAPVIDGRVDEDVWREAAQIELDQLVTRRHDRHEPGETPEVRTIAWLGHDGNKLYVGVHCHENGRRPLADQRGADNLAVSSDDSLELFLRPAPGEYLHFFLGAGGATREQFMRHGRRDADWTVPYRAAAQVTDEGWSAEWAIPFYALGFEVLPETLGFNLGRLRHVTARPRAFTWAAVDRRGFHAPDLFGLLEGLGGLEVPPVQVPRFVAARVREPYRPTPDGVTYGLDVQVENLGGLAGPCVVHVHEQDPSGRVVRHTLGTIDLPASGSVRQSFERVLDEPLAIALRLTFDEAPFEDGFPVAGDSLLGPGIGPVRAEDLGLFGACALTAGDPIGGGPGYSRLVDPATADAVAATAGDLVRILREWNELPPEDLAGKTLMIPGDSDLALSAVLRPEDVRPYQAFLTVPSGVTLAGERGRPGREGARLLYSHRSDDMAADLANKTLIALDPGARLTGLRIRGPDTGTLDPPPPTGSRMRAVRVTENAEVDNCEISHFHWACVDVQAPNGLVRHNSLSDSAYPVSSGGRAGYAVIVGNRIRWGWHAIAGSGWQNTGYEAAHNEFIHIGPGGPAHAVDMHAWRQMMRGHGPDYPFLSIGGDRIVIRHNTFSDDEEAIRLYRRLNDRVGEILPSVDIALRGVPRDLARIHHNRLVGFDPRSAIRFYSDIGGPPGIHDRANLWIHDNLFGPGGVHVPLGRETLPRIRFLRPGLDIPQIPETRQWSTRHVNKLEPGSSLPVDVHIELFEPLRLRRVTVTAGNRDTDERVLFDASHPPAAGEIVLAAEDWNPGVYYLTVAVTDERNITGRYSTSFTVAAPEKGP